MPRPLPMTCPKRHKGIAPTPLSTRVIPYRFATIALLALFFLASGASAQSLIDDEATGPTYRVGAIEIEFANSHPDNPPIEALLPVEVTLRKTASGWSQPIEGKPAETLPFSSMSPTRSLDATAVVSLLSAIVNRLHEAGFYGVDVRPAASDFDLANERDLRSADRDALSLEVRIGRISQIRTIAGGDRVKSDWKINNEIHAGVRTGSPLQPAGSGDKEATDLLDRRALEDYLHRLNRHPGRRVEAALSPAEEPGEVVLDYRVLEAKPWFAYAQGTNTGTTRTNRWQTRFGYSHRQLTDRDDILTIEYLNAGGDDVNALTARYQAPFFGSERPDWMSQRRGDPEWLDLIPRKNVPWWGVDRLRWEAEFNLSRSQAGEAATALGIANDFVKSDELLFGGRLIYEAFQYRNFFVDVWGGMRVRDVTVNNRTNATEGDAVLVIPRFGLHAEQRSQLSTLGIDFSIQGQINDINDENLIALGRSDTDEKYAIVDFNVGYSTYLEPIFNPEGWRDPSTHLSSTLAHEISIGVRGQIALDEARLIPQANGTIGGFYSVRGYPQSTGVGDTLVISSFEYRFHVPRIFPVSREPLDLPLIGDFRVAPQQVYGRPDWDLTLRAFIDIGRARRNNRNTASTSNSERNQTLIGAGVGTELQFRSNFRARLDWATALKNENVIGTASGIDAGDSEIHVLFSILY